MLRLLAARAALVSLIVTTVFLAPSVGYAALYTHLWSARLIMAGLLGATWCAFYGYAAAWEHQRRVEASDAALTAAHQRLMAALDRRVDVGLRAVLAAPTN